MSAAKRGAGELEILAVNPPGFAGPAIALAATRAGFGGAVSLEHVTVAPCNGPGDARRLLDAVTAAGVKFTVLVDALTGDLRSLLTPASTRGLERVILCEPDPVSLLQDIAYLHGAGLSVLVQATCLEQAQLAERCEADGLVVKGSESGGRIGEETTLILLQRILPQTQLPVWARGGVGLHSAAACLVAGAVGVVLDWQLALCAESELPDEVKARVARMDGSETAVLGQERAHRYRAYFRPGETAFVALKKLEEALALDESDSERDRVGSVNAAETKWREAVESRLVGTNHGGRLLLIGQDAVFASVLADRFRTVKGICHAIRRAAVDQCRLAAKHGALRPGGPLAESHGTRYPIVQGPMTRVSDTADFALAVAEGGGLPFLALALLRGPQVAALLEETKHKLGPRPWGIGILGFVPKEFREEQLAEVRKHPPPYAIIAGGRPDQAVALERDGIHTYLHIPSPALLKMFLEGGVRRVIFEGRECGGHVGPRTSLVLWDQMIRVILEHLSTTGSKGCDYHVLFAGGIHDQVSASMVAAMASPLSERGVRIGVLLGTSYLFTKEAVSSGAIVEGFQREAIECQQTILLESGVGHATRCADTAFGRQFAETKRRLIREGRSKDEVREALEMLNLGRLRIASKGITRSDPASTDPTAQAMGHPTKYTQLDDEAQRQEGMYMIGQVAALRERVCTIEELHADVSRGGAERLDGFAACNVFAPQPASTSQRDGEGDEQEPERGVAIIGMSCMFPKAGDLQRFWENILNKVDGIMEIPAQRWKSDLYFDSDRTAKDKVYSKWGGFLDEVAFDPTRYGMPPTTLPSIEPLQLLVLEAVRQAIQDAGYAAVPGDGDRPFDRERASVILGAGGGVADLGLGYGFRALLPYFMAAAGGDESDAAALIERLEGVLPEWTEDSFAGLLMNVAAGRIANRFDLGGTNYTVDAACASSLAAVRLGVAELESGSSDLVIVGGADTMQNPFAYLCFSKTQALSPTGQCRTFDASADGIVISEGIAVAVLKRLDDAIRDDDRIYAVIKGVGASSDGKDKGLTAPRPAGQIRALERAYAQAGYSPKTVGLVEAHGTGTVAGDQSEVESLTATFAKADAETQACALGSVKSMIGHTKCTAGVAGLLKAALALHYKVLPPTNGVEKPNPRANFAQSPFYLNTEARPWLARLDGGPRRAGVSAFGFGGTNFHAALEEFSPAVAPRSGGIREEAPTIRNWPAELFVWRGGEPDQEGRVNAAAIVHELESLQDAFAQGAAPLLRDLAAAVCAASARRSGASGSLPGRLQGLALVATSIDDLKTKLTAARAMLPSGKDELRDPTGIYYSSTPLTATGRVAFVFPGQGSQSVNMLRDLAVALPCVRSVFEEADRCLGNALGRPLSGFIFPRPAFSAEEEAADEAALTRTNVAQPAMGAADLAMFGLLSELGIRPDLACGHSYGEYVALCAAGVVTPGDLVHISEARGRLIVEAAKDEPGTMAAVDADERAVAEVVQAIEGVGIANLNSPTQTVIAGTTAGVDEAVRRFEERGVAARRIRVSCAFHSPLVAGARRPFGDVLTKVSFAPPRIPVYSNTTALRHPTDGSAIRAQLVEHLARPVRFADELLAMHDAGARVFVEVGPGRTLTGLVERTLAGRSILAVNLDQPGRHGLLQLVHALGQLAVAGVAMNLEPLFAGRIERTLDLARLVEQTKPAPLPPTTWMVGGSRAVPVNGQPTRTAAARTDRPIVPAAPSPVLPADVDSCEAPQASPSHSTAQPDGVDSVMSAYQAMMTKFLDTQKNVMLSYLQGAPATAATSVPPASPMPSVTQAARPEPLPAAESSPAELDVLPPPEELLAPAGLLREPVPVADALLARLVKIVSDRTGYPPEMLDVDLDLEADLGIDSIKRIEILGTLQNDAILPSESVDGDMEVLAKLKTLRAIVDWIAQKSETATAATAPQAPAAKEASTAPVNARDDETVPRMLLDVVECHELDTGRSRSLDGVVVITDDETGVATALAEALTRRGAVAIVVAGAGEGSSNGRYPRIDLSDPGAVAEFVERTRQLHGRICALVHLLPLSDAGLSGNDGFAEWDGLWNAELLSLFNLAQRLESDLRTGGTGRVLTATRLGGAFACDRAAGSLRGATVKKFQPGQGGVCGVVKTLAREWPDVRCKTIDFDLETTTDRMVTALLNEFDAEDSLVEVGYRNGRRVVVRPTPAPLEKGPASVSLDAESVVLITGGARGITAEVAMELAQRFGSKLILAGRSPLHGATALPSGTESAQTAGVTEAKALKAILREQIERAGERATPACIESAYTRLCRDREIRSNLAAMRSAGATVEYHAVDVGDRDAFGALIADIYRRFGRVDGVIHGAGVTEDKLVRDKTLESFQRVLRPKVEGAFVLASTLQLDSLRFLFFFSSVSARYGNRGQSDYAAANEVLNKLAHWLNARCAGRVASLNWGPWESTGGMVSPELAKQFAKAGIRMISRPAGRRAFLDELMYGRKGDAEVLFGGPLTVPEAMPAETVVSTATLPLLNGRARTVRRNDHTIEVVRELDPSYDLYLLDHQLDGKPVMPMAIGLELLSEVAAAFTLPTRSRSRPDLRLAAMRELRVLRGITLENGPRTLRVTATPQTRSAAAPGTGDLRRVDLRAETGAAAPGTGERPHLCYTATAELRSGAPPAPLTTPLTLTHPRALPLSIEEAYEQWLFHGPLFAGIVDVEGLGENGIIGRLSPSSPRRCLAEASEAPLRGATALHGATAWLIDPVIVDSGLQLIILWARTYLDMTPLPSRLGCYHWLAPPSRGEVRCEIRIRATPGGPSVHNDLKFFDPDGRLIGWMEDMEATCSKALNRLGGGARASSAGANP